MIFFVRLNLRLSLEPMTELGLARRRRAENEPEGLLPPPLPPFTTPALLPVPAAEDGAVGALTAGVAMILAGEAGVSGLSLGVTTHGLLLRWESEVEGEEQRLRELRIADAALLLPLLVELPLVSRTNASSSALCSALMGGMGGFADTDLLSPIEV